MDAKSTLDKFARAAGFAGGVHWMHNYALMFIRDPDPLLHEDTKQWLYLRDVPQLSSAEQLDGCLRSVMVAESWNDAAAKVCRALARDSLYVGRTKIGKSTSGAAEFIVECGLLGLGGEEEEG